jgi:hypothetical protein
VELVENRVLGMEDKVEELDQTVKDQERILRNINRTCNISGTP